VRRDRRTLALSVIAASILWLSGIVVFSQGDTGAFKVLERLPSVDANGPSEFAPLAVGSGHLVLFGHSDIALFRKASGNNAATLLDKVSVRTFFANPTPPGPVDFLTDPDVVFDPEAGRFFMALADTTPGRLQLLLAVSRSPLPETMTATDWYTYRLDRNDSGIDEADFDHIAIAGDKLLISWQRTGKPSTGPIGLGTTIRVFDKRPFMQGSLPGTAPIDLVLPSDRNLRARPASISASTDRSPDRIFYDIWSDCGPGNRRRWLLGVVSGLPSSPVLTTREVATPLPCVNNATLIPQPGNAGGIRTSRLAANPSYRDGRLWVFEWGDGNATGTTSGIEWVEVDVRGWPDVVTTIQAGVHREPGVWLFAPAGIVDARGNMVLTYSRSSPSQYPSSGLAGRLVTDSPGTTRQGDTLYQGQRVWDDTDRLASVLGAAPDFVDGSVWVSGITPTPIRPAGTKDSSSAWVGRLHPPAATLSPPGAPTAVSAVAGNAQAIVTFTAPTSTGGAAITSYTATASPGGTTASGTSSPLTVSGLSNGTAYTFTVRAINSVGTGPASSPSAPVTPSVPTVSLDRTALQFSATTAGLSFTSQTSAQTVRLTQAGAGPVTWTAASTTPWLGVSPTSGSGSTTLTISTQFASGLAASQTGRINLALTGAGNTAGPVNVTLTIVTDTAPVSRPFGVVDTPVGDATVLAGSIAVTGWTLDNIGVRRVELWRDLQPGETTPPFAGTPTDPRTGKVFIANATFVDGARPDIEGLYPTTPVAYRAGWGYLLLTWGLWNQGNGTYKLYAFAFDLENNAGTIGSKTIIVSNNAAVKPFGSIDTPEIGGDASGPNFGWGLTPKVNGTATCKIQSNGVQVSIDSGPLQPVVYGDARTDIAGAFSGFSNTAGAGGHFIFDWSTLTTGAHTIGWLITDDCNRADGVGSRFFNVTNGISLVAATDFRLKAEATESRLEPPVASAFRRKEPTVLLSRGYGELPEMLPASDGGTDTVEIRQGERIELRLPRGFAAAYQVVTDGQQRDLPAGSTWDAASGIFYWQPAPAFLGRYRIVFTNGSERISVRVVVVP
jgi:hypothetical protein